MQIIIDNIRSASNIGSIFRTGDAFSIRNLFICGISAIPPNKEILKTALGATETVSWEYHSDAAALVRELKKDPKNLIVSIEQAEGSKPIHTFKPETGRKFILVMGNEVEGVSPEVLQLSDVILEIPQFGSKKSLNVAVAAGIAVWELLPMEKLNTESI